MATNFPTSLDDGTNLPNPTANGYQNSPDHASLHANAQDGLKAVEAKIGTGSSTPTANKFLFGTGSGTSAWTQLTSSQLAASISDETGSGAAVFANTPTLVTPKVDTINESTLNNGVTVGGVNLKSGALNTSNSVPTAAIQAASITNAKLATSAGEIGASWQSWTPTWTGLTVGNATVIARYLQIGKMMHFNMSLLWGSTTAITTTYPNFTMPTTPVSGITHAGMATILYNDNGIANYYAMAPINGGSNILTLVCLNSGGTYVGETGISSTVPFTFGTSDNIRVSGVYETA